MKAPKAKSKKDADLHTVTFRLEAHQRQKLIDYALALGAREHRHVSNNEAMRNVLDNLKIPAAKARAAQSDAAES